MKINLRKIKEVINKSKKNEVSINKKLLVVISVTIVIMITGYIFSFYQLTSISYGTPQLDHYFYRDFKDIKLMRFWSPLINLDRITHDESVVWTVNGGLVPMWDDWPDKGRSAPP